MKIIKAKRIAPDGTPRLEASDLGQFCLPMSHKKDARLIWVIFSHIANDVRLFLFEWKFQFSK